MTIALLGCNAHKRCGISRNYSHDVCILWRRLSYVTEIFLLHIINICFSLLKC